MTKANYLSTFERVSLAIMSVIVSFTSLQIQTASAASVKTVSPAKNDKQIAYVIPPKKGVKAAIVSTDTPVVDEVNADDSQAPSTTTDQPKAVRTMRVDMTAYTSTVEECDGNPFITADGSVVEDGIVATNVLPFGTKIRIPDYFGDRVFTVHDRMNARYSYRVDLWMSDQKAMRQWGIKHNVKIEVVEMGDNKTQWGQWKGRTAELNRIGKYGLAAVTK